jgi:hypothetical protein
MPCGTCCSCVCVAGMVMYERHAYRDYMQGLTLLDLGRLIESDWGVIDRVTGALKPILSALRGPA